MAGVPTVGERLIDQVSSVSHYPRLYSPDNTTALAAAASRIGRSKHGLAACLGHGDPNPTMRAPSQG